MPKFRKCDVLMRTTSSLSQRRCQEEIDGRMKKPAKKSK